MATQLKFQKGQSNEKVWRYLGGKQLAWQGAPEGDRRAEVESAYMVGRSVHADHAVTEEVANWFS
jgi:hypothetical protein